MKPVLEVLELSKFFRHPWTYRRIRAVEGLCFAVRPGEVFGLIGHNGAGKTTTFKMLVGLLRPSTGRILWHGTPSTRTDPRRLLGFAPEQPYFYDYLTVRETLDFYAHLYGMSAGERRARIGELAERFGFAHKLDARMRTLSKGNLQRVAVAQAILHRPQLAILDEPMSGLDPLGRRNMRELIAALAEEGTTVLFSSHVLSDTELLCQRVAILAQGELKEVVDLQAANGDAPAYLVNVRQLPDALWARLREEPTLRVQGSSARAQITAPSAAALRALLAEVVQSAAEVESVLPYRPSLEERFLRYVPNGARHD
jgi:ABC-2 type transport system ATP-binding protein